MTTWPRIEWEQRVADAGLSAGAMITAQALARLADDEGMADPGLVRLARDSRCSLDTAHRRLMRLERAGLARRLGRRKGVLPRRAVIRWQLTVPATADVGQP